MYSVLKVTFTVTIKYRHYFDIKGKVIPLQARCGPEGG